MKLREAWRLSRTIAVESMLRGTVLMRGGQASILSQQDPAKLVKRARSSLRINKIVFAFVYGALSLFMPFGLVFIGNTQVVQFALISLFYIFGLVFLITFNLMATTSFVTGDVMKPIESLPFSRGDLAQLSVLSFLHLLDLQLAVFIAAYPIAYGLVTGSLIGAIFVLLFNSVNAILAVFLTFFLARGFYRRILSVGGSRIRSAIRTFVTLLFGIATLGMSYFVTFLIQGAFQIVQLFTLIQSPGYSLIILVYPFSFGYLAAELTTAFSSPSPLPVLLSTESIMAILASAFYVILAYLAYKRGMGALRQISLGEVEMAPKLTQKLSDVRINVGGVFSSIFKKDIRLASRNVGYAVFLAMPIMGVIIFTVATWELEVIRVIAVLGALLYSSEFMVFFAVSTMWFEGRGVSVLAQLPISTRKVVQAKSFASTALSIMMPATLLVVSFFKPLTTFYSIVISIIEVGAVYASAYIATTLVCRLFGEGRMPFATFEGHLLQYIVVMIIGGIFVAAPVGVYAIAYSFLHYDHLYSTLAMGIAVVLEVLLASAIARKALKD